MEMKIESLVSEDLKPKLLSKLNGGWAFLMAEPDMMVMVEQQFFSGEKNKDFIIIFGSCIYHKGLFGHITLGKKEHIPGTCNTDRVLIFHEPVKKEDKIEGVLMEAIGSTDEGLGDLIDSYLKECY